MGKIAQISHACKLPAQVINKMILPDDLALRRPASRSRDRYNARRFRMEGQSTVLTPVPNHLLRTLS
jgi:hypothetical protein